MDFHKTIKIDDLVRSGDTPTGVIPAEAGIQGIQLVLDLEFAGVTTVGRITNSSELAGASVKNRVPVVDGWVDLESEPPHLLGSRCRSCGDTFFPKASRCRNPNCMGEALEQVSLSRKGKLWSYTVHHYQPPPPYVPPDPFVPYAIAVVELPGEKLMVLGQVASGCDYRTLRVGMDMELVVEPLYEDREGNEHMVWKWRPCD